MAIPRDEGASHRTALDGLRAIAIGAVMCFHAGVPGFRSGWIGVDVFFVLSGFLITSLLMVESAGSGSFAWPQFMARRALRLAPAYFLYAVFITCAIWLWPTSTFPGIGGWTPLEFTAAIWTYTINFVPQGGVWNGQDLTIHLWSLAVEQQYYLVWPVIILILQKRPRSLLFVACLLTAFTICCFIASSGGLVKYNMLQTRGFSLILSSVLALWVFHRPGVLQNASFNLVVDALGVSLLTILTLIAYKAGWSEARIRDIFIPLLAPIFALWVARLWLYKSRSLAQLVLQSKSLVYVGKISYGLYLYHEAVRVGVWYFMKPAMLGWPSSIGFVVRLLLYIGISGGLAAISYEFFEKRCLQFAGRFRAPLDASFADTRTRR